MQSSFQSDQHQRQPSRHGPDTGVGGLLDLLREAELEKPLSNLQTTRVCVVCDTILQWHVGLRVIRTMLELLQFERGHAPLPDLMLEVANHSMHALIHFKTSHAE
jgi:hypothetical protein